MDLKGALLFASLVILDVASWTVRREDMELSVDEKPVNKNSLEDARDGERPDVMEKFKYANGYDYQGYREMKISNVIRSGSVYLEGLSGALLDYRHMLEACGTNSSETSMPESSESCASASEDIKLVQRLSELALETTKKLRDKGHGVDKDDQSEENELILQLAWFLDQLARLTGYKQNDTNIPTDTKASAEKTRETNLKDSLELLETVENGRPLSKLPPELNVKSVVKRSTVVTEVAKYYNKYEIWTGSNSNDIKSDYDVSNDLNIKPMAKRSIPNKKYVHLRVAKTGTTKTMNVRKLFRKPNVVKVVVVKKIKNKY
ncbi:hypothetical protein KGM_204623 [Danaus plexippus plexippus]|uniref:Uncharacterized protein n=1 Tax=Danaus plexippus plexippus TaxID=278856 RepID=A0A212EJS9_DANPL|nr:hypothetical protein KGM_204623 [Danaus plexippus plexippus]